MTIELTTLKNGLQVVTDTISHVETATLGIWVDIGARHETEAENGISHVLEHMAFKGTTSRTSQEIAEEIEAVGGYLNAYTSRENTAYHARILKENVPLAVDILSDILQHSVFDETEFDREKTVILQEIGQTIDTPDDIVFDYFQDICYPNQPMGRPILGTVETVNSFSPPVVKSYMADKYHSKNMIFAAAGNVDHQEIVKMIEDKFSSLSQEKKIDCVPASFEGGDFRKDRPLEQVHMVMGFEGVPYGHEDYYTSSILATILGGGMSSRLFQEIREKRGLVYTVYAFSSSYRDTGTFGIYAGTGADQVGELIPVTCDELRKSCVEIEQKELSRAKSQVKAGLMMSLESTTARCERLAQQMLIYGRPISSREILEKVEKVSIDHLHFFAANLFKKPLVLTTLGPIKKVPDYDKVSSLMK